MPAKFSPTEQQKKDVARFVVYELWMLRSCAEMPRPTDRIERNFSERRTVRCILASSGISFSRSETTASAVRMRMTSLPLTISANQLTGRIHQMACPVLKLNKDRMDFVLARLELPATGSVWRRQGVVGDSSTQRNRRKVVQIHRYTSEVQ